MAAIRRFDEFPFGISWVMDEPLQRTSHALVDDGRVWLIDPLDHPDAMARVPALGTPAAVLQLLDRHKRDCAAVAARLGVPHFELPEVVPDSPFEAMPALRVPGWKETALWWPEQEVLVVAEVVGTNDIYTGGRGTVGIHPFLRAKPPGALRGMRPQHLLVGHGTGVHGPEAATGLERAYAKARRDIPHVLLALPRAMRGGRMAASTDGSNDQLFGAAHVRRYRETDGEAGHDWRGTTVLILTTTGSKSGEERSTPLIYQPYGDDHLLVASNGGSAGPPAWFVNLEQEPEVEIQIKDDRFRARARIATPQEKPDMWRTMTAAWPAYDDYQRRTEREIPVVVLERR